MTPKPETTYEFAGDLCVWRVGDNVPARKYIVATVPYGVARRFCKPHIYDPLRGTGEQRQRIDSHVRKLKRAILGGEYTPTAWAAGVRKHHMQGLVVDEEEGVASLVVDEKKPLPQLDGGHRGGSLEDLRKEAEKDGDAERLSLIDTLPITIMVHFHPGLEKKDFENIQKARPVDRSQLKAMERQTGTGDPKKKPFTDLVWDVAIAMNDHPDSFLKDEIRVMGPAGDGGRIAYASISSLKGSDLASSLGGGAKIALHPGFSALFGDAKGAEHRKIVKTFLVDCYVRAYMALYKYGQQEEMENAATDRKEQFPGILMPRRVLRPTKLGGTKGGTGLLMMLGNCLAFRCLAVNRKAEISTKDEKRLVEAAELTLDLQVSGGLSGATKRELAGEFVRRYFEDAVSHTAGAKQLPSLDGVPALLCQILSRSTFNVDGDTHMDGGDADSPLIYEDADAVTA